MKYIHLSCLKQLIQSKITSKTSESVKIHSSKSLECDMYKTLLPEKIKIRNKTYHVIDFHKPKSNYLIFESVLKETNEMRCTYFVHMKDIVRLKLEELLMLICD